RVVARLFAAAGRLVAFADPSILGDPGADSHAGSDIGPSVPPDTLARALQRGALLPVPHPTSRDLAALRPVLVAHASLVTSFYRNAAALREVLRELYPAALRAFHDPATPIPLAILSSLSEPGLPGRVKAAQLAGELVNDGLAAEVEEVRASIEALQRAVTSTPRKGLGRSTTAAVAAAVRQAVAAVRASESGAAALIEALNDRIESPGLPTRPVPQRARRRMEIAEPVIVTPADIEPPREGTIAIPAPELLATFSTGRRRGPEPSGTATMMPASSPVIPLVRNPQLTNLPAPTSAPKQFQSLPPAPSIPIEPSTRPVPERVAPPWQMDDLPSKPSLTPAPALLPPPPTPVPPVPVPDFASGSLMPGPEPTLRYEDEVDSGVALIKPGRPAPISPSTPSLPASLPSRTRKQSRANASADTPANLPVRLPAPATDDLLISRPMPIAEESGDGELLIFAAARSAWFSGPDEERNPDTNWNGSADVGWRAAELASQPTVGSVTGGGLPRRVPKANLVPGSAEASFESDKSMPAQRDAAEIAGHTSGYFRGWQRGKTAGHSDGRE
ncbi:MAG: hypothetical protein H0T78_05355, partial [Longispora sp.]|nr:hypothetical protein [Longispora sp. (in: high G+C Gram-positive bacteria)]